ncbi:glycosyltransferase [Pseudonocardia dioxanivorans]|uniref:glycosyltransferase n=1 Tax=Pseudonocardia dioxanivorans TaxID=240495 RepID=UPI000CD0943E|nr:glycosyltransferase [Pseudonocardia dioxanivorans]
MRIAMVSEHASPLAPPGGPDSGGQNVHVRDLALALADAGHDVTVSTRREDPGSPDVVEMHPRVRVRHVPAGPARRIAKDDLVPHLGELADGLRAAWHADPPDVVHAHFWMSGLAASAALRGLDVPLVQTFHALGHVKKRHQGPDDTSPDGRVAAERALVRRCDRIVATCEDELFELLRLGAPRSRVSIVPCGVDATTFTPDGPVRPRGARPRIVSIGRLVRRKGVDEVIAALRLVPAAELLVAGGPAADEDPAADPDLRRLAAVAEQVGVLDRVRFLGPVARIDVPALLRSADVVACTPWYEPFGMVPLEAMACGRAVVGTAVGGLLDTVVDGVTGRLVPPRRPRELGQTLARILGDPVLPDAYGLAGRDRVVARYTWPKIAEAIAGVYGRARADRATVTEDPAAAVRSTARAAR